MSNPEEKKTVELDQLAVLRGMLQRAIDVGEASKSAADAARAEAAASRAEGEARGMKQDRAIALVSRQMSELGSTVEKIDRRVKDLEDEGTGIKRQASLTEEDVTEALSKAEDVSKRVTVAEGDIADVRMAVRAVTTALELRVPRPDGTLPPEGNRPHRNALQKQSRRSQATLWLVAFVVAAGGLKEIGFFEWAKGLFFSH